MVEIVEFEVAGKLCTHLSEFICVIRRECYAMFLGVEAVNDE